MKKLLEIVGDVGDEVVLLEIELTDCQLEEILLLLLLL
jgi:hypothetical protein